MKSINVVRYARIFEILCMILIPITLIVSPIIWFFGDNLTDATYGLNLANFSFAQRILMSLIDTIGSLFVVYGLILLIHIARTFQKNEIFTQSTVNMFLRLRTVAGLWALYNIAYMILFPFFFTTTFPASLIISSIVSTIIVYIFIFVFLSILATLIVKATELQGDQDLTV